MNNFDKTLEILTEENIIDIKIIPDPNSRFKKFEVSYKGDPKWYFNVSDLGLQRMRDMLDDMDVPYTIPDLEGFGVLETCPLCNDKVRELVENPFQYDMGDLTMPEKICKNCVKSLRHEI